MPLGWKLLIIQTCPKAAEGKTANNIVWKGANGMASSTWKLCLWCIWYHSTDSVPAITTSLYFPIRVPPTSCDKVPSARQPALGNNSAPEDGHSKCMHCRMYEQCTLFNSNSFNFRLQFLFHYHRLQSSHSHLIVAFIIAITSLVMNPSFNPSSATGTTGTLDGIWATKLCL